MEILQLGSSQLNTCGHNPTAQQAPYKLPLHVNNWQLPFEHQFHPLASNASLYPRCLQYAPGVHSWTLLSIQQPSKHLQPRSMLEDLDTERAEVGPLSLKGKTSQKYINAQHKWKNELSLFVCLSISQCAWVLCHCLFLPLYYSPLWMLSLFQSTYLLLSTLTYIMILFLNLLRIWCITICFTLLLSYSLLPTTQASFQYSVEGTIQKQFVVKYQLQFG